MLSIVLATGNPFKVQEIEPILRASGVKFKLQSDFFDESVEEDGLSFLENAIKKARFASEKTGLPALADDSGLEIDYLGGKPGIYSARYASGGGENMPDTQNLAKVLEDMQGLPYAQRQARYSCAMVYVKHAKDPMPLVGVGHWAGEVLTESRTGYGVGYDDIFWVRDSFKAASEMTIEAKNQVSHRAMALRQILKQLQEKAEH